MFDFFATNRFVDIFIWGWYQLSIWQYVLITLFLTHITIAAVTIFLHRCQAHRSLELHTVVSHFFRLWLWLTTGMVTREWAAVHRKHHAKVETAEDPHSPQIHGLASVLWSGVVHYVRAKKDAKTIERYGYGTPDDWVENHVYSKYPALGVVLMAFINVGLFGFIFGMSIWLIQMFWIPFWAAGVINGIGHFWGYRNFHPKDESRNIVPFGIVIGGEELHNNHHAFPTSARLSNRWYEFDIGWLYVRLMEKVGLAKIKRVAPRLLSSDSKANCDLDTLQSIITNRLEVVARFTNTVKKVCQKELVHFSKENQSMTAPSFQAIVNCLRGMENRMTQIDKEAVNLFIKKNTVVYKIFEMRNKLVSLWEDSTVSASTLVERLGQWCREAETSNVDVLVQFSRELRGYKT